jgi:hypothetical protein
MTRRAASSGGEVADVRRDHLEAHGLSHLSLREEPVGNATLVEDLDRS